MYSQEPSRSLPLSPCSGSSTHPKHTLPTPHERLDHRRGCHRSQCTAAPTDAYKRLHSLAEASLSESLLRGSECTGTGTSGPAHTGINFGEISTRTAGFWGFFQFYWDEYSRLMTEAKILMVPPSRLPSQCSQYRLLNHLVSC